MLILNYCHNVIILTFYFILQGSNSDLHNRKMRVTFIQARKIMRVAFSSRQNVEMKLE